MKTSGNTILITGGGSGIGLELARQFSKLNNRVVICGRNVDKLRAAESMMKNVTGIQCDVTDSSCVDHLFEELELKGLDVNVLINNAGKANAYLLGQANGSGTKALDEIQTNYVAVVELTERFLPILRREPEAAIINVSSVVALVPAIIVPTYSASKAALHSYTQSLRLSLRKVSNIKVFEVMPPVVDTDFSKDIPGSNRMAPSAVAEDIIKGIESDDFELPIGATRSVFAMHKQDPMAALEMLNRIQK
jgi:uncharacterized oxidoreductase